MTVSATSTLGNMAETPLQKEQKLFWELFSRLVDALLNRIFDLRPEKAVRRRQFLLVLFLGTLFIISLQFYPLSLWGKYIQEIWLYYSDPAFAQNYIGNPLTNFVTFVIHVYTDPRIAQYFPIFLAPFFIALQCAALYLADIFELEHISVARNFIWAVALSGSEETILVSHGNISEASRQSPTYLIGGPGQVIVELDSVALFEKPDGSSRVIGPTGREPRGRAALDGFERFRQAIDIRDQHVDLRDQDPKSQSVKGRSLDGIPVTATDVRLTFSIYRGEIKPSQELPYPFSKEAIEQIVYQASSRVTPELPYPSTYEFSWINRMINLIRVELGAFMSKHKLTAYLASIGSPEVEKLKRREEALVKQVQRLTQDQDFLLTTEEEPVQEFLPRYKISSLFTQFAEEFTKRAQNSGVELHWIGVGTWKTPIEIVSEKHLEAWKLSNENLYRESNEELGKLEKEAIMQKTVALIQDVPVTANIRAASEDGEQKKRMRALLQSYLQQLLESAEFMRAKGEAVPLTVEEAIAHIKNTLYHYL